MSIEPVPFSRIKKRSFTLRGARTSIALEPAFWLALTEMQQEAGDTMPGLISRICIGGTKENRASQLRVACLNYYGHKLRNLRNV